MFLSTAHKTIQNTGNAVFTIKLLFLFLFSLNVGYILELFKWAVLKRSNGRAYIKVAKNQITL